MAKFKKGDRVRRINTDYSQCIGGVVRTFNKGEEGCIEKIISPGNINVVKDGYTFGMMPENLELITPYTKDVPQSNPCREATTLVSENVDDAINYSYSTMLKSIEWTTNPIFISSDLGEIKPINKPTLKQKTMNALKKLTQSKEDKVLEKAGYIDECGEPTRKTTDILIALLFTEKKAELVTMAEAELKEDKA